jgi:hypothetical protein
LVFQVDSTLTVTEHTLYNTHPLTYFRTSSVSWDLDITDTVLFLPPAEPHYTFRVWCNTLTYFSIVGLTWEWYIFPAKSECSSNICQCFSLPNTDHYKNCTKCTSHLTKTLYDSKQFPVFHCVTISLLWHKLPHPIRMQDFRLWQPCSCGLCSSRIWHCINGWLLIMFLNHTAVSKRHAFSASDTMPYPKKNQDLQERQQNSTGKMF